jgi:hypothetical protein
LSARAQPCERQGEQRRAAARDQAQHGIVGVESLHQGVDALCCGDSGGVRYRVGRLDDLDTLAGNGVAIAGHHHSRQLARPVLLQRPGHRRRGLAGTDHDQSAARWFRQVLRDAVRRLRGGDRRLEHLAQQAAGFMGLHRSSPDQAASFGRCVNKSVSSGLLAAPSPW